MLFAQRVHVGGDSNIGEKSKDCCGNCGTDIRVLNSNLLYFGLKNICVQSQAVKYHISSVKYCGLLTMIFNLKQYLT